MIELQNIHLVFNAGTPIETHSLRGVDLAIGAGEFVTVIGSNGAGKSSLLNVLTGDAMPQRGRVLIDTQDVTRQGAPVRAASVARVFQDPLAGTCADLTIAENLALAASRGARRGMRAALSRQRRARFRDKLAELGLGLENRLNDPIGLLSGGQRQAVSLVMATLAPMKILLLDEHTAALDPGTTEFVLQLTRRIVAESGLTTLMVTHSMRQALDYGTRTVMMHQGQVVLDIAGEERARLDTPDLLALFARQRAGLADAEMLLT